MRTFAAALGLLMSSALLAADPKPTAKEVEEAGRGGDVKPLFAKYGTPKTLVVAPAGVLPQPHPESLVAAPVTSVEEVFYAECGYGTFGFLSAFGLVGSVYLPGWEEPVHGIKLGDSVEAVQKVLGSKYRMGRSYDNKRSFHSFPLPDGGRVRVFWDQNRKADRIEVLINQDA